MTNHPPGGQHPVKRASGIRRRGRPPATPNKDKAEYPDIDLSKDEAADVAMAQPRRPKKPTRDERFEGMSEKEKLEAMGMDKTWTEYSVLLMERPGPGVYITPRGRRRPAGKKQGRPRISRIAVFKSPKLASFPWFRAENEDHGVKSPQATGTQDVESPAATSTLGDSTVSRRTSERVTAQQPEKDDAPEMTTAPTDSKKRNLPPGIQEEPSPKSSGKKGKRPYKRQRLADSGDITSPDYPMQTVEDTEKDSSVNYRVAETSANGLAGEAAANRPKRRRPTSVHDRDAVKIREVANGRSTDSTVTTSNALENAVMTPGRDEAAAPLAKKPRRGSDAPRSVPAETETENATGEHRPSPSDAATDRDRDTETAEHGESTEVGSIKPLEETPEPSGVHSFLRTPDTQRRRNIDKGGSVALLRRKIVMDIVNKAGGAFPFGTEIWYPFTTAWAKMSYKEIPDMRTVRTVVKNLVEAGKLRQMTFSGKDAKGVMVTKSIITKPDLQSSDPVIKDLQSNMLAESKLYFPPNTDVDPTLTKSGTGRKASQRYKPPTPLPVETGMTVQLHQKPAAVLKSEEKKGRRIERQLLQSFEHGAANFNRGQPGVIRLMKIQRRPTHDPSVLAPASIARPVPGHNESGKQIPKQHRGAALAGEIMPDVFRRIKRPWRPISTIGPYAMLMTPSQTFNARSGTFSTDAGAGRRAGRVSPSLPESLSDLLGRTRRRKSLVQPYDRFFSESDAILRWELKNEEMLQEKSRDFRYINQTIQDPFEEAQIEGDIRFDNEIEEQPSVPNRQPMTTRRRARQRTQEIEEDEDIQDGEEEQRSARGRRALPAGTPSRRLTKLNESVSAGELGTIPTAAQPHRQTTRRRFTLPQSLEQKIMTAIAVIRTLAGGFEGRVIDWALLPRAFPTHDPRAIQDRGRALLSRNRLQLAKMQSDFQERFIEAYTRDEVPRIDYENLERYDWEGVVDWAHTHLDAPSSQKLPDLPATREQFDSLFELREEAPVSLDELYQVTHTVTVSRKRALPAMVAFAVPLASETPRKPELSRLEVAKTWIRANVTTPEETYRSREAWQALRRFEDPLVESAVQSLVTDRVISMGNRGRITPGRNYDVTDHFLFTLGRRRAIEHTQLRRAAKFKTKILDPELEVRGTFDVNYHAEDGDILTLINLASAGRLTLKPRDPPNDKFGLTEGGYVTRQVDKEKLRFSVEVQPVAGSYVYGNPLRGRIASVAPPCPPRTAISPTVSLPEKIPIWFDIHGQFNKLLWDQVVAAIVGCVAMRPGISAGAIAKMIQPTMGTWEVQMLLEWMAAVGVAKHEGQCSGEEQPGWRVEEWWWMILGGSALPVSV